MLRDPSETKTESSGASLSQRFLRLLQAEISRQDGEHGLIATLQWELKRIGGIMEYLPETDEIHKDIYNLYRRVVNDELVEKYGYKATLASFYALALEIDELKKRVAQPPQVAAIDKAVQNGIDKIDEFTAKRIAQLLDMKGHEAMYDTGTKPSGTN